MEGRNTGVESVKADRELKRMFVCVLERACCVCVYMVYTPLLAFACLCLEAVVSRDFVFMYRCLHVYS